MSSSSDEGSSSSSSSAPAARSGSKRKSTSSDRTPGMFPYKLGCGIVIPAPGTAPAPVPKSTPALAMNGGDGNRPSSDVNEALMVGIDAWSKRAKIAEEKLEKLKRKIGKANVKGPAPKKTKTEKPAKKQKKRKEKAEKPKKATKKKTATKKPRLTRQQLEAKVKRLENKLKTSSK